jgi:hypothetical protein
MFDLVVLADSLGFDVAWLAELHFGGAFSLLASPLMAVPVIAQRTRRIRIGTAVTLLPLQHPLSCAEQAARDEFGLSQIICWFDQGNTLSRAEVERTMRRFAEQIMPKLA